MTIYGHLKRQQHPSDISHTAQTQERGRRLTTRTKEEQPHKQIDEWPAKVCDMSRDKRTDKLTLTISGHLRHGGILHHSCMASTTRHHGSRVGSTRKGTRGPHGELVLLVIHHLLLMRLVRTRTWLHLMRALSWCGAIEMLTCSIAEAIGRIVHSSRCQGRPVAAREGARTVAMEAPGNEGDQISPIRKCGSLQVRVPAAAVKIVWGTLGG